MLLTKETPSQIKGNTLLNPNVTEIADALFDFSIKRETEMVDNVK